MLLVPMVSLINLSGVLYQLTWGSYRGDRIGIFNFNTREDKGYVDVDWFRYDYGK